MREIKIEAYSFEELSKEIQDKIIEKNRHVDVEGEWWSEDIIEEFIEEVSEKGFQATKVYFSGFWSQGDGAMFEYSDLEDSLLDEFADSLNISPMRKKWLKRWGFVSGKGRQSGHYSHERSCTHHSDLEADCGIDAYPNLADFIVNYDDEFYKFVEDKYIGIAQELYATLEKEYEYKTSDEVVKQAVESFDCIYNKQGIDITSI